MDAIASLKPDLIVATNAGLDQDTYNRLTRRRADDRAVRPGPFFEPWKIQATAIGQAVFKHDEMQALIAAADEKLIRRRHQQPAVHR